MVCARTMRDLCEGVEEHRSRGQAGYAGDEFCRGEEVAGRGGVLEAPEKALRASWGRGQGEGKRRVIACPLSALRRSACPA